MKHNLKHAFQKGFNQIPLLLLCMILISRLDAQSVSGKVTDAATGEPLTGASVREEGTQNGAITDVDGRYKLTVSNTSARLSFSYTGYQTLTLDIGGSSTVDATLISGTELDEVVVTALGISREKKSLTYGAQEVGSGELTRVKDANVINALSGRTTGLQINRSGSGVGGSTRVVMRGQKSTRDNNVLYVIDGIPIFNFSPAQPGDPWGGAGNSGPIGRDGGDAIGGINPDDIESITVLKGASAAALYGSQASNGVIVINTKKGKAGATKVEFSSNATFETPVLRPELQFDYIARTTPTGVENFSWGEKVSSPDHVKDFFQTGGTYINSVSMSGGNQAAQTYFSYANTSSKGVMPTSKLSRHNVTLRESAEFLNGRLTLNATLNYSHQQGNNRNVSGLYFNPLTGLYLFPRGAGFENYSGNKFETYVDTTKLYTQNWVGSRDDWQNPEWILNRNPNIDVRNRIFGTLSLGLKLTDWANIQIRGNMDRTNDRFEQHCYAGTEPTLADVNGRFVLNLQDNIIHYGDVMLNLHRDLTSNLNAALTLGSSINDIRSKNFFADSKGPGLRYANTFVIQNILQPGANIIQTAPNQKQLQSVFGSFSLGYKNMLYLDVTGRNDWSSTLAFSPSASFFYPSVGLSAILSEMFNISGIDYAKVRGSFAQVGNGVNAYDTNIQNSFPANGSQTPTIGLLGEEIKPELSTSLEFGADVRFWNNRAAVDLTWYKTNTINQRIDVPVPIGSGLSRAFFNAGDIQNSGIEASVSLKPVQSANLEWNTQLHFTKNPTR
jgi:TonB-linked SusC/RagA family outer membrane protein